MEQSRRSESEGEVEGLDKEGFFFFIGPESSLKSGLLLPLTIPSVVCSSSRRGRKGFILWDSKRPPDDFTKREHTRLGIAWEKIFGEVGEEVSIGII